MTSRIFWLVKGSGPANFEHPTYDAAANEARRMAAANPGIVFHVCGVEAAFVKTDVVESTREMIEDQKRILLDPGFQIMTDIQKFLRLFDDPQVVQQACNLMWGRFLARVCEAFVSEGFRREFLAIADSDGPIDGSKIYSRLLCLTDAGRDFCGLPRASIAVEKPAAKTKHRTLFD